MSAFRAGRGYCDKQGCGREVEWVTLDGWGGCPTHGRVRIRPTPEPRSETAPHVPADSAILGGTTDLPTPEEETK